MVLITNLRFELRLHFRVFTKTLKKLTPGEGRPLLVGTVHLNSTCHKVPFLG